MNEIGEKMEIVLGVMSQALLLYLNCKLLTQNWRVTKKELRLLLLLLVAPPIAYLYVGVYSSLVMIPCAFIINYCTQKKLLFSIGIISYASIIMVLSDHFATMFEVHILAIRNSSFTSEYIVGHMSISIFLSLTICFIISKLSNRIEEKSGLDIKNNLFIIMMGLATMLVYYASVFLGVSLGNSINLIQLNLLFFIGYLIATLVIFFFYVNSLRNKYEIKQKEIEYESMRQYTEKRFQIGQFGEC